MPALPPYIPVADPDFALWIDNFSTLITATPATYGLVAGDASAIAGVTATWDAAYALVTSPATKTPVTVQAKNTAKINALATVRPYSQQIALNAGVSSDDKIALGLNPRQSTPTPITTPTTNPVLTLDMALTLQHVIRYRDSTASPSVKAKPYGAVACELWGKASATAITDPANLLYLGPKTKTPFLQSLDAGSVGQRMYYAARWVTTTGLVGPFSPIVSFIIAS